jgi:2-oxo-4-hydroxy-4-carboxy-5-ureidoimidazoline decarboxylase
MTLEELNRCGHAAFVAALGGVFEHSPWVAESAFERRPFADADALHAAMSDAVRAAPPASRLALIRAHPELAGREAVAGALTAESTSEQSRLGFSALPRGEFERMAELNRRYREKFGFPCIVALKLHESRRTVVAEFERRLANGREREIDAALEQIGHVARGRLDKLLGAN